jgi:hypothetical protein
MLISTVTPCGNYQLSPFNSQSSRGPEGTIIALAEQIG